jgi:hypothetical protein
VARLDGAPDEHDPGVLRADDGADRDLGIEIENGAAPGAYETVRLAGLEQPRLEPAAAFGTVPVGLHHRHRRLSRI